MMWMASAWYSYSSPLVFTFCVITPKFSFKLFFFFFLFKKFSILYSGVMGSEATSLCFVVINPRVL